ncbi:hypothetical protein NEMBOFW57_008787 [Staphylotrichum longicolle]|uniref:Protein kinase domain-containing protein n=1 Tax=Staphylotrichum longicolle TaxID=669026 RepID=A0AAD4ESB3_9PEZI|nr:hypothetical protein NEMBOFW57_008787 [Staphylotrichum longicolle]
MSCALEYLHSKGVVHRDIKPENIMYDHTYGSDNLSFFLGDFGLSMTQAVIQNKPPGGGTDFYNAPEIEATGAPTPASDIWALGVLGYWCGHEMSRSGDFWNWKLAAFGCPSANYRDPLHLKYKDLMLAHRVLTFARQAIIPVTLSRMMSGAVAERPSAAELCRTPLAWLTDVPRESAAMRAATEAAAGLSAGPTFGQELRPGPNAYGQPQPRQPAAGPPLAPLRPSNNNNDNNNNNYIFAAPQQRSQNGVANVTPRMAGEARASDWATTSTGRTGSNRAMPKQESMRNQGRLIR